MNAGQTLEKQAEMEFNDKSLEYVKRFQKNRIEHRGFQCHIIETLSFNEIVQSKL